MRIRMAGLGLRAQIALHDAPHMSFAGVHRDATDIKRPIWQYSAANPICRIIVSIHPTHGDRTSLKKINARHVWPESGKSASAPHIKGRIQLRKRSVAHFRYRNWLRIATSATSGKLKPQRRGSIGYLRRKDRLVYVYAHSGNHAIAVPFTQDPAHLAAIYKYVIRPFDLHAIASPCVLPASHFPRQRHGKPLRNATCDGKADNYRQRGHLFRRHPVNADDGRHHKVLAGRREPPVVQPSAARHLPIRREDVARPASESINIGGPGYGLVPDPPNAADAFHIYRTGARASIHMS